jgi:hypothetical protein
MRKKTLVIIIIAFSVLILLLLAALALYYKNGPQLFTKVKTVEHGEVLFADNFSDPQTGWDTWSDEHQSKVVYQNDGLRILVNLAQFDYWSRPGLSYQDVQIEVDAAKVGGPNDNDFGVICRYQNQDNFYALLVSSDGYYGILKVKDGVYSMVGADAMQYSEAIHKGDANNHLRADCVSNGLILWANGEKLVVVRDGDFTEGDVGVIAGTNATTGVDIFFDNFVVYNP